MIVEVYSDGSGTSYDKPGGWAFCIVVDGVKVHEDSGHEDKATNNTMELTAALNGLSYVCSDSRFTSADVVLVSDSQLVLHFADGTWQCKKLHLALLAAKLRTVAINLKVTTKWVKGHAGNEFNEICDKLAGEREPTQVQMIKAVRMFFLTTNKLGIKNQYIKQSPIDQNQGLPYLYDAIDFCARQRPDLEWPTQFK